MLLTQRNFLIIGWSFILIIFIGCSPNSTVSLKGKVLLDGEVVEMGSVSFLPMGMEGAIKVAAEITQGKYAVKEGQGLVPGKYKVEIHWSKGTGKKIASADPGVMMEKRTDGSFSQEMEVLAGNQEYNFQLKTK